jgi:hypothetical protein
MKYLEMIAKKYDEGHVDADDNLITFSIQDGPVAENGVNGVQITALIEVARDVIECLNNDFPCSENIQTLGFLEMALKWQERRTQNRMDRGVEGKNLA